jgi:hypothetical protein
VQLELAVVWPVAAGHQSHWHQMMGTSPLPLEHPALHRLVFGICHNHSIIL